MFFLLLFFLSIQLDLAKDKEVLFPKETLQVVIQGKYEDSQTPYLDEFIKSVKSQNRFGSFQLQSSKVLEKRPGFFRLQLVLEPLRLGNLIFAPGMISFSDGAFQDVPSFQIEMKRRYQEPAFVPPLPCRPEEAIVINEANKKLSKKDPLEELQKIKRRSFAWNILFSGVLFLVAIGALFWGIRYYRALPRKEKPKPPRNFVKELEEAEDAGTILSVTKAMLSERFGESLGSKTVAEIVAMHPEIKNLKELLERLEVAEFSGKPLSDQELQAVIPKIREVLRVRI